MIEISCETVDELCKCAIALHSLEVALSKYADAHGKKKMFDQILDMASEENVVLLEKYHFESDDYPDELYRTLQLCMFYCDQPEPDEENGKYMKHLGE